MATVEPISDPHSRTKNYGIRKHTLFKKSAELRSFSSSPTLAGATSTEMAVAAFSPFGHLFATGHPDFDTVIKCDRDEQEKRKTTVTDNGDHDHEHEEGRFWWDNVKVDELSLGELQKFKASLEQVKNKAFDKAIEVFADTDAVVDNDYVKKLLYVVQNLDSPPIVHDLGVVA